MVRARSGWMAAAFLLGLAFAQPSKNDFRFCILGDRTGDAQPGVYERVWRAVAEQHPDFAINVGDTIQGGDDATVESEWAALKPLWERRKFPFYLVPGNHDIWSVASRRVFERESGHPASYGFDFQNAHFTVLDNSQTEDLSEEQMQFLERDLAAHRDRDPKFVFFHKPFWLVPVKFQSAQFPFHQLAWKYGVGYVVSGHGHQFLRLTDDGVVYVEAGSSGGKLKGEGFFGYTLVRVVGGKVEMKEIKLATDGHG